MRRKIITVNLSLLCGNRCRNLRRRIRLCICQCLRRSIIINLGLQGRCCIDYGLIFNIMTLPFMLALGVGTATGVRVGIANARADAADATLAGWTGLTISTLGLLLASVLIFVFGPKILGLYSSDPALVALALPLVALVSWVIILDGDQAVLANALRGLGETWIPTLIQSIAYIAVMLPVSWALALPLGRGVAGLLEALIVGSVVSVVLQSWWFRVKSAQVGRGGK